MIVNNFPLNSTTNKRERRESMRDGKQHYLGPESKLQSYGFKCKIGIFDVRSK